MPLKDIFGGNLPRDQVADGKIVANPSATIGPDIQGDACWRNGRAPSATGMNLLNESANQSILYRSREYFSSPGFITTSAAGETARHRFAFRSGNYSHAMGCVVMIAPQSSGFDQPSRVRLDIATNAAGTPAVLSQEFVFGAWGGTVTPSINDYKILTATIDGITPNTDYYAVFTDVAYGRLVSACCYELASLTENADGYLSQGLAAGTPILSLYRSNLIPQVRAAWTTGAAKLWTWTVNDGTAPNTTTSATAVNVIDETSMSVSTTTPGPTLDLTYCARASQQTSGVPCVMKVYGHREPGGSGGTVELKDSGGNVVATITGFTQTAGWLSTTCNLPATQDKYDLTFRTPAGTLSLYACSLWQEG